MFGGAFQFGDAGFHARIMRRPATWRKRDRFAPEVDQWYVELLTTVRQKLRKPTPSLRITHCLTLRVMHNGSKPPDPCIPQDGGKEIEMADGQAQEGAAAGNEAGAEVITTYKGFDANLACRGFQYEVGGEYVHEGAVAACKSGFHACEYPLDVLGYYAAGSRYCVVEQGGQLSRHDEDSKVASSRLKVSAEIGLPDLIKAAIEYTTKRCKPIDPASPASSTGTRGAASSTGYQGAAMASGYAGKVMGAEGNALFLVERDDDYSIVSVWAGIAGRDGIKANTWYALRGGKPVEV